MPVRTQFNTISSPRAVPPTQQSRAVVAKQTQTMNPTGRNLVNHGKQSDNPQHHYAGELEARKWSSGQQKTSRNLLCTPGPKRQVPSYAFDRKAGYGKHMGRPDKADSFRGARGYTKSK